MKKISDGYLQVSEQPAHRLYWSQYGDPAGEPILLLHGASGHIFDMEKMTAFENQPVRLIEVHQRGVGLSEPHGETDANTVSANLADIEHLRTELGIDQWSIFAWSGGSVYMGAYAMDHPENCKRLIAYAPYLASNEDYEILGWNTPEIAARQREFYGAEDGEGMVRSHFNKVSSPDFDEQFKTYFEVSRVWGDAASSEEMYARKSHEEWQDLFRRWQIGAALDLELFTNHNRMLEKMAARPGHVPFPDVTLIYGGKDGWAAPTSYAKAIFPKARTIVVSNADHDVHKPEVQKILRNVLRQSI